MKFYLDGVLSLARTAKIGCKLPDYIDSRWVELPKYEEIHPIKPIEEVLGKILGKHVRFGGSSWIEIKYLVNNGDEIHINFEMKL